MPTKPAAKPLTARAILNLQIAIVERKLARKEMTTIGPESKRLDAEIRLLEHRLSRP